MKTLQIKLATIEDVRNFVNTMSMSRIDADLKSGRYTVDASSLMGIFSLDLLKPLDLVIHSDNCDKLLADIAPYIVK